MEKSKISIPTSKGKELIILEEILYCKAKGRYTNLVMLNGKEFLISKILKAIEQVLPKEDFYRTHKTFLININHVIKYPVSYRYPIILKNNVKIKLAKRRSTEFRKKIESLAPPL